MAFGREEVKVLLRRNWARENHQNIHSNVLRVIKIDSL